MKRLLVLSVWLLPAGLVAQVADDDIMMRGDANGDGVVDHSDGVFIKNYLTSGGPDPDCMNQADSNDDGAVTLTDATYLWNWLYSGGSAPPAPGPFATECSADPTPSALSCAYLDCS